MKKNGVIGSIITGFPFVVVVSSGEPLLCQFVCEIIDWREHEDHIDVKYRIFKIRLVDPVCGLLQIAYREIFGTKDTGIVIIPVEIDVNVKMPKSGTTGNPISKDNYAANVYDLYGKALANFDPHFRRKQHKLLRQALPKYHLPLYYKAEEYLEKYWTGNSRTEQWVIEDMANTLHDITNEELNMMADDKYAPPVQTQYLS